MPKRIDGAEFRDFGYLQEVNRQFLHPLGLALEVVIADDGAVSIGGVWDCRDNPGGMAFSDDNIDVGKVARVQAEFDSRRSARIQELGSTIQPLIGGAIDTELMGGRAWGEYGSVRPEWRRPPCVFCRQLAQYCSALAASQGEKA